MTDILGTFAEESFPYDVPVLFLLLVFLQDGRLYCFFPPYLKREKKLQTLAFFSFCLDMRHMCIYLPHRLPPSPFLLCLQRMFPLAFVSSFCRATCFHWDMFTLPFLSLWKSFSLFYTYYCLYLYCSPYTTHLVMCPDMS